MSYQVALTQVAFNRNYENVMRFDNRAQQEQFFRVDELFNNAQDVNLLKGNFFNLEIPWKVSGNTLKEMESYNYCIIREAIGETYRYYYYFITNMRYDQSNQFILSLELDVMNTYYIDAIFSDGLINRAHLNRWIGPYLKDGEWHVKFNNAPDSLMLIPDTSTDLSMYCKTRDKIQFNYLDWINENVDCWVYVFLRRNKPSSSSQQFTGYKYYDINGNVVTHSLPKISFATDNSAQPSVANADNFFTYICYPLYKGNKTIKIKVNSSYYEVGGRYLQAEDGFRELNNDASYWIAKVVSKIPPSSNWGSYNIEDGNLIIENYGSPIIDYPDCIGGLYSQAIITQYTYKYCVFVANPNVHTTLLTKDLELPIQTEFKVTDIQNSNFNPIFNPKLLSSSYQKIRITNDDASSFDYDIQKMNTQLMTLKYTERPQPGVTRSYTRLNVVNNNYGIYTEATEHNLTGLVVSQDCNLSFDNDVLENYLANNRNAQTQITYRSAGNIAKALTNLGTSMGLGAFIKGAQGLQAGSITGVGGFANSLIDLYLNQREFELSKDNMSASPDQIKNANGDIIFNGLYTRIGLYIEHYQALDCEFNREAERMNLFGFKYNRIGNVKNFDNIRAYFNFVQGVVETVLYNDNGNVKPVPNIVLNKFKDIFNKGVRFWNYEGGKFIDYSKENIEIEVNIV